MTVYEFTIHLAKAPTRDQYGVLATQYDDLVGGQHGPVAVVDFYRAAPTQVHAIESALHDLRTIGLEPVRIEY